MKKSNPGGGDLTRQQTAKARRIRRKTKLDAAVGDRVKGLFMRLGAVQQELLNAQARIRELETTAVEVAGASTKG